MEGYLANDARQNKLFNQIRVQSPALKCKSGTMGKKDDPTFPLVCHIKQITVHALSSYKVAYRRGNILEAQQKASRACISHKKINHPPASRTFASESDVNK
ncbi:hypothetical protein ElyMa_002614800 [Elysia marginata]|uniref:DRBM domain-containing protein n=1 Tax=Elysia marginata TaxID=1093978 RepID=A0AAV4H481_9GAST|nr:hypothetical protein ElyMa_002614800 [Elysia marginata]